MNGPSLRTVEVECMPIGETDAAWRIDDGYVKAWLPKSVVKWQREPARNVQNVAIVDRRMADAKGLT